MKEIVFKVCWEEDELQEKLELEAYADRLIFDLGGTPNTPEQNLKEFMDLMWKIQTDMDFIGFSAGLSYIEGANCERI